MTRDEFLSAARKGQGRALLALRSGEYRASFHDIRRLVIRWPGYDAQMEGMRGWYTVELMEASGYAAELAELVIRHLSRRKGYWAHGSHRESTVYNLAQRGYPGARAALYAGFDPADEFRFSNRILAMDGLDGLSWLISQSVGHFDDEAAWRFKWWLDDLTEALSEDVVCEWLTRQSSVRPEVAEFAKLAAKRPKVPKTPEPVARLSFEELRERYRGKGSAMAPIAYWVRQARPDDMTDAWRAMATEDDPEWLRNLARELSHRPALCPVEKIISRARSWQEPRNPFLWVLEEVVDPRVREFGFELIASGRVGDGLDLVVTNAVSGDEVALLAAVTRLESDDDRHSAGLDLLNLGPEIDGLALRTWVYEFTPCAFCRESALRDLIERGQAPHWMLTECLADCNSDTREMAAETISGGS